MAQCPTLRYTRYTMVCPKISWLMIYVVYPPTPAFAKAGAAPGTTAGVEPVFVCHYLAFRQALRPLPSVVKGVQACCEQALRPLPSVVKGVQACRLPPQTLRGSFEQALPPLPSVAKGVQACRLPGLKCLKRARQLRAGTQATGLCC